MKLLCPFLSSMYYHNEDKWEQLMGAIHYFLLVHKKGMSIFLHLNKHLPVMLLLYLWFIFNAFLLHFTMCADPNWKLFLVNHYFWLLFIYSYLPRIIAESFCRGLSSSHTAAAGRPFRWAEVWKWRPRCFRTGCRDGEVFTKLQGDSGGPVPAALTTRWRKSLARTVFTVLWQLTWGRSVYTLFTRCPACLQARRHGDRFTGSKQKRLSFKTLAHRNTILFASAFPYVLWLANMLLSLTMTATFIACYQSRLKFFILDGYSIFTPSYKSRPCLQLSMSSLPQALTLRREQLTDVNHWIN